MAVITKKTDEKVVRYSRKIMTVGVECDICHGFIKPDKGDASKYFRVCTGHHDWGNDSGDSIEYHDVCPKCLSAFVSDYLRDGRDTSYIDIETEFSETDINWTEWKEG